MAFYFVHWVTDLAGAEPTPLKGCEKFVLKFPQAVFSTIVGSMPIVQRLSETTPTALYEAYLTEAWEQHAASLGPSPSDGSAIALMRLLVQVINALCLSPC